VAVFGAVLPWARGTRAAEVPTPILEYRFEEGSGPTTANTGSFGNIADGTFNGGAAVSTDVPPNIGSTSSLALPDGGPNTAVLIPDNFNYTTDGSFGGPRLGQITVEAWIKPTNLQLNGEDNRVVWDDYGNPGVLLSLQADGRVALSVSTDQDPSGVGLASGQVVINTWQHIAGVYNGTQLRIFVNGQDTCIVTETSGFIIDQSSVFPGAPIRIGNTPAM
jgi:hypothetical protein